MQLHWHVRQGSWSLKEEGEAAHSNLKHATYEQQVINWGNTFVLSEMLLSVTSHKNRRQSEKGRLTECSIASTLPSSTVTFIWEE